MADIKRRYSQIEKEALALVCACEKLQDYVLGKYLSRAPVSHPEAANVLEDHLSECFVHNVLC